MQHTELVNEVTKLLAARFQPKPSMIKQQIEVMLERVRDVYRELRRYANLYDRNIWNATAIIARSFVIWHKAFFSVRMRSFADTGSSPEPFTLCYGFVQVQHMRRTAYASGTLCVRILLTAIY